MIPRLLALLLIAGFFAFPSVGADRSVALAGGNMVNLTCAAWGYFTYTESLLPDGKYHSTITFHEYDRAIGVSCPSKPPAVVDTYDTDKDLLKGGCATDLDSGTTLCVKPPSNPALAGPQWTFDLYASGAFLRGMGTGPSDAAL